MSFDLVHILPLYARRGQRVAVSRDHFGSLLVSRVPYPPIEVASAAGVLRARGFRVGILAADALMLSHEDVVRRARALDPAHIHMPMAYPSFEEDARLLRMLRVALPRAKVLLTGPNVTQWPERVLAIEPSGRALADEVIQGEIEPGLLEALLEPSGLGRPNRAVLSEGRVVAGPREIRDDLSFMVTPARDLLPLGGYHLPFAIRAPSTYLETSRGCVYRCAFCAPTNIIYRNRMRFRPLEAVFEDLESLVGLGYRDVTLKDLTFPVNRGRVVAFCEGILARGLRIGWRCFSTVDLVDLELLRLMKRAGCYQVCYGFESGDDRVLAGTGKGTTVEQGRWAARWTHQAGIEVAGTFMLGLPGDTAESMERTIRLAMEEPVSLAQFTPGMVIPGTPVARTLGVPDDEGASEDPFTSERNGAGLPGPEMNAWLRRANRRFYLRPHILTGRLRSLRSWPSLRIQLTAGLAVVQRMAGR